MKSPAYTTPSIQVPRSPTIKRASLPPIFPGPLSHFEAYKASPLQNALTPPPPEEAHPEPFPSVESLESSHSGHNFHMPSSGLSNSDVSPTFSQHQQPVQIYCAKCRRINALNECYACTECISGFCADCVYVLSSGAGSEVAQGRACPRCGVLGARYKLFQLEFR